MAPQHPSKTREKGRMKFQKIGKMRLKSLSKLGNAVVINRWAEEVREKIV